MKYFEVKNGIKFENPNPEESNDFSAIISEEKYKDLVIILFEAKDEQDAITTLEIPKEAYLMKKEGGSKDEYILTFHSMPQPTPGSVWYNQHQVLDPTVNYQYAILGVSVLKHYYTIYD